MELEKDEMDMTDIVNLYFKTHIRKYTYQCLPIIVRTNIKIIKLFFMLNQTEHEIVSAHKNFNDFSCFHTIRWCIYYAKNDKVLAFQHL